MDSLEVLVLKFFTIDRLAPGAITLCKVAALDHEGLYDAVEQGAFVMKRFTGIAITFLAGAEGTEILGGFWDNCERWSAV
jgi:hypothetical protein